MASGGQVNINPERRQTWVWAAVAGILVLSLILILFFLTRRDAPPVAATPTPTTLVVEEIVTSTPEPPTPTPVVVEVEVTPTPEPPTPTPVVVEVVVTPTPGPEEPSPTPVVVVVTTTPQPGQTPAATPAGTPQSTPLPTLTSQEQRFMDFLRGAPNGDRVVTVRYNNNTVEVLFRVLDAPSVQQAAQLAKDQVRNIFTAIVQVDQPYTTVIVRGTYSQSRPATGEEPTVIELTYTAETVKSSDWTLMQPAQVYTLAENARLEPGWE